MKHLTVSLLLLLAFSSASFSEDSGWKTLFNGKNLDGWKANEYPENFTATKDGVLRAHGVKGASHLYYCGEGDKFVKFKDFELELECRGKPGANSGIFFHTDYEKRGKTKWLTKGYELQLNSSEKEKRKTGSLYGIVDLDKSPVDESQWFKVRLRVEGKHIQVWLNDELVQDYTEPEFPDRPIGREQRLIAPNGNGLALQAHDPNSIFDFRGIRIRELGK